MRKSHLLSRGEVCALLACLALFAQTAAAQTQTASVRGVVRDASHAVVPSAVLTLTNTQQNRSWKTISNKIGEYLFSQIPPGAYTLSVAATGFRRYDRQGLILEVAQVAQIDVTLELGAVNQTVEVTAATPVLEAATSTLGETVNAITTESLPLNGRNVLQLVQLTPGINTTRSYRNSTRGSGDIGAVAFSANGGRNVANMVMLDGSPQEVMGYNQPAYIPTPDAVQEFKVQTNALSAEYGRTGGAVINIVHRSGTSQFHSVLYEFLRNDKFDANGFFNNRSGQKKPAFRFNQFGFTLGGPLTPSRETTFFFVNYEGTRQVNPGSATFTVPTARMRQGDFSEIKDTIYDPATINSKGVRSPFPNNMIPQSRIDPIGTKLLSYYPAPTRPGVSNNFFSQQGASPVTNNFSTKVDRRISERQNLFGRFSWLDLDSVTANHFGNVASPDTGFSGARDRSITVDDTYTVGGWILHGNYGYGYHANPRRSPDKQVLPSSLGFPQYLDSAVQYAVFPRIQPAGYASLGGNSTWIIGNRFETHTWSGDISKLIGSHTIKFGGSYRLNRVSNFRAVNPAGRYDFDDNWTRKIFNKSGGGDSIASMLLGLPSGQNIRNEPALASEVKYTAAYFQDDWRATHALTLNLGLRWDTDWPLTERFDRASWFDLTAPLPLEVPGLAPLTGGLVFAGRGGPRGIKNFDGNNFAPRIGFAYRAASRLVVRSGFGIFYNPTTGIGPNAQNTGALGFNAITPVVSSIDGGRTPYATLQNPFPDGFSQPENGQNGLLTFLGQSINGNIRNDVTPYSMQWNFDVQYQLPSSMLLDVAYAGNSGVHLQANSELDQLPDALLALGDHLSDKVANPFYGLIPDTTSLGKKTTTRGQLLRPFPQFTGVVHQWGTQAHSTYHALQTKFRKRYANGLQFLVAYTWSKMIDDVSSVAGFLGQQNPGYTDNNNRRLDRSISALDVAHRLVFNYEWELPFGKGKALFPGARGLLNQIVSGWDLNGFTTIQSGLPISISSRNNTTSSYGGGQRPNSTGVSSETPGSKKDRIDAWFNPDAFVNAPAFAFGNVGRFLPDNRGPYYHSWDLSVLKNFSITEKRRLQFRAEFFNLFNQVNFQNPAGNATVFGRPQFGQITGAESGRIIQFGLKFYY